MAALERDEAVEPPMRGDQGSPSEQDSLRQCFGLLKWQPQAYAFYQDLRVQLFVAGLIGANFINSIIEKQIDPEREEYMKVWNAIDKIFTAVFALELSVNMYSLWFWRFWKSNWNKFDTFVVAISFLDATMELPDSMARLRMMRVFRVFRLFERVESFKKIVVALVKSVPGMLNALIINIVFMCIYAVLAVDFYGHSERSKAACLNDEYSFSTTGRDLCWADEYYGTFGRSLYTLFQVLTGDSWSEAVVRPVLTFQDSWSEQLLTALFFVSFIMLNAIILINVVVAILVDNAIADNTEEEDPDALQKEEGQKEEGRLDAQAEAKGDAEADVDVDPIPMVLLPPLGEDDVHPELIYLRQEMQELSASVRRNVYLFDEKLGQLVKQVQFIASIPRAMAEEHDCQSGCQDDGDFQMHPRTTCTQTSCN